MGDWNRAGYHTTNTVDPTNVNAEAGNSFTCVASSLPLHGLASHWMPTLDVLHVRTVPKGDSGNTQLLLLKLGLRIHREQAAMMQNHFSEGHFSRRKHIGASGTEVYS